MHVKHEERKKKHEEGKKKQKKEKKKKVQGKQREGSATPISSRDCAVVRLKGKKKKPKICGGEGRERIEKAGAFAEEVGEQPNSVSACTEQVFEAKKKAKNVTHRLRKLKDHNQAQGDGSSHAHVDQNGFSDRTKQKPKKVRFSDEFAPSTHTQNVSVEVCNCNSRVSKESLAHGCASCKEGDREAVPFENDTMNSNASQPGIATDEKSLLNLKRQKDDDDEVWGKRFTPEEDELLKNAILEYIKSKGWEEEEGINKVFNSKKHKDARNCWADIKLALPHRPRQAVRYRAHLLLEKGAHAGKWSEEEEQLLNQLQRQHGRKWKKFSVLLNRHRTSIKEKWRSLKRTKGKGVWTQGELQQLYDLVHTSLRAKALISKKKRKLDRHILRDDINWEKIADTIGTHNHGSCCGKWYYNLQSSLVTDGLWADEDDLLLLESLLKSGACAEEEVEWDSLLNHRSGQVCLMRWKQMVKHLGENRTRQFLDKLDILARRYAPELLESSAEEMSSIQENPCANAKIGDS